MAALLALRIRPAAPSDREGTYLVRELDGMFGQPVEGVPISFVCECCTTRVARGHLLGRQKTMILISRSQEGKKNRLPKCPGPVKMENLMRTIPQQGSQLIMHVYLLHRQSPTLLDPTEGIEQLTIPSVL